jgi:AraC family transcriptional activator of tynA and feaB
MMETPEQRIVRLKGLSSQVLSTIFVNLEMRNATAIEGRYAISQIDDVRIIRATSRGGCYEVHRRDWHIAAGGQGHCFVCLPLRGEIRLRQDDNACVLQPRDFGFVDTRREYTVEVPAGADAMWIRLAVSRLNWRLPQTADMFARRIDGGDGIGLVTSSFIRSVAAQADRLPRQSRTSVASMVSDLLAEAATEVASGKGKAGLFRAGSQRTLDRARIYIDQHLDEEDLSPSRIAAAIGISSRYLSQLFAGEGQTTMAWVLHRRLERCRERLEQEVWRPGLITELAFMGGFANVSSFNRAFKAAFGRAPREVTLSPARS